MIPDPLCLWHFVIQAIPWHFTGWSPGFMMPPARTPPVLQSAFAFVPTVPPPAMKLAAVSPTLPAFPVAEVVS
jgi:hypothetical protein